MARKTIDSAHVRQLIEVEGKSQSEVARLLGKKVSVICAHCKRNNIKSKFVPTPTKDLDLFSIRIAYESGVSMYQLAKDNGAPPGRLKRRLKSAYPDLEIRDHDQAVRPNELNDPAILSSLLAKHSRRKIAAILGVKPLTVCHAVYRLGIDTVFQPTKLTAPVEELIDLYVNHGLSLTKIAKAYGVYPTTVLVRLKDANVTMRGFGVKKESKHKQLNDREWLIDTYVTKERSMAYIASLVGTSVRNVSYHLDKHGIPRRSHEDVIRLLLRDSVGPRTRKYATKFGELKLRSKKELEFIESLPDDAVVEYETVSLRFLNLVYIPDFKIDGRFYEVKPHERAEKPGVNRQKFIKQSMIAKKNGIDLKVWYKSEFTPDPITDEDVFYALDWRLFFQSHQECSEYLLRRGWEHPLISDESLHHGLAGWLTVPDQVRLNANIPKPKTVAAMRHFHPHYYRSARHDYKPVAAAFEPGNSVVLREAMKSCWERGRGCNIHGLIQTIAAGFKDFVQLSMFKPWVARYVYDKLLGGSGTVVDPCAGWGGRALACIESEYEYRGSDLNRLSVAGNAAMVEWLGARYLRKPTLSVADASMAVTDGDLLFTSPPYDDTEHYHGLDEQCSDSGPIYDSIFGSFKGIVALNVPLRHAEIVIATAKRHGWMEGEHMQMKTANFIRRDKTYEPILVFHQRK